MSGIAALAGRKPSTPLLSFSLALLRFRVFVQGEGMSQTHPGSMKRVGATMPKPSIYLLLYPKYPLLGTIYPYLVVSQNYGYLLNFGVPIIRIMILWGSILGSTYFGKLPFKGTRRVLLDICIAS